MSSVDTTKEKWEITIDVMLIIGKYFETGSDYVNVMRMCKKYHDLVRMYHYNPISDCALFWKMETQYLYGPGDKKIQNMHQYVYLYYSDKKLEKNEIIKYNLGRCIRDNNYKLKEWSGCKLGRRLYDSNIDGKDSSIFRKKIMNHNQLYFIVIDSNYNVFGHYHDKTIDKIGDNEYAGIFAFTLNSNGRC